MTRKDYELIAKVLDDLDGHEIGLSIGAHQGVAEALADALAATNPRFDRTRFLRASGVVAYMTEDELAKQAAQREAAVEEAIRAHGATARKGWPVTSDGRSWGL